MLGYWNVAVRLAGKIEPPYGRPGKRAERGQRCRLDLLIGGKPGDRRKRLFAGIEDHHEGALTGAFSHEL